MLRDTNIASARPSENKMPIAVGTVPQTLQASPAMTDHVSTDNAGAESGCGWVARLIEADGERILRLLWRILGREQDVMDAYQDCFCKLASLPHRPDLRSATAYAYRTATNIAVEMIRSRMRRQAHWPGIVAERPSTPEDAPEDAPPPDRSEELRQRIAELPPHLRNVIVLRDLNRLSYEKVGRMLGIEPATARVYRRHAVVKLAELIGGRDGL